MNQLEVISILLDLGYEKVKPQQSENESKRAEYYTGRKDGRITWFKVVHGVLLERIDYNPSKFEWVVV